MIKKIVTHRIYGDKIIEAESSLAVEEPLQIVIQNHPYTVVMRLPGNEIALAAGLCLTDGIIDNINDLAGIAFCKDNSNKILVTVVNKREQLIQKHLHRKTFISQSSCGICGKEMIDEICTRIEKIHDKTSIPLTRLFSYTQILKEQQKLFTETGCVHAAALFNSQDSLISFAEDVGRHNALDKAIGLALLENKLDQAKVAVLSSRASFEMVQKIARAKIPIIACVSAPTYLGVELAQQAQICMVGFVRQPNATIYTFPECIL